MSMSAKQFWKEPSSLPSPSLPPTLVSSFSVSPCPAPPIRPPLCLIQFLVSLSSRCDCPNQRKKLLFLKLFVTARISVKEPVRQAVLARGQGQEAKDRQMVCRLFSSSSSSSPAPPPPLAAFFPAIVGISKNEHVRQAVLERASSRPLPFLVLHCPQKPRLAA